MLNRKEAMKGLLEQVAHKLHKTEEQIAHLRWFTTITSKLYRRYLIVTYLYCPAPRLRGERSLPIDVDWWEKL
jgi:hypothetical protein